MGQQDSSAGEYTEPGRGRPMGQQDSSVRWVYRAGQRRTNGSTRLQRQVGILSWAGDDQWVNKTLAQEDDQWVNKTLAVR